MPSAPAWSASEPGAPALPAAAAQAQALREAGRDRLSLALLDARNRLLAGLAQDESPAALRLALTAGHYQEHWISCHPQRQRGEAADARASRLAGLQPALPGWLSGPWADPRLGPSGGTPAAPGPTPADVRGYLADTLELTLDLLAGTPEDDAPLYVYRMAVMHEDRLCEALAGRHPRAVPPPRPVRGALGLPGQRWALGTLAGTPGLVPAPERWAHAVQVPAFDIDAQPVNWAQFAEFAEDGGYDRAELWSPTGWAWVQATGRRAPRGVVQWRGGVVRQAVPGAEAGPAGDRGVAPASGAGLQRAPAQQPALHVTRHEAEAWCCWAGRRLPTEPEWELAACTAAGLGFVWGDVLEWVAGSARPWPGAPTADLPGTLDPWPEPGLQGVLRGASFAMSPRGQHPKARRFAPPDDDRHFCGFRSCAG